MRMLGRVVAGALLLAASIGIQATARAAKANTVPEVPLVVTVEDFATDGSPCRICSDGGGAYVDGEAGVSARLDQYGNLIINFNATASSIVRNLRFDYADPVDPLDTLAPPPPPVSSYMSTRFGKIQSMLVGDELCVESAITFKIDDRSHTEYRNLFRRPADELANTSFVVVTRNGPGEWEAEPKPADCNLTNSTVARVSSVPTRGSAAPTIYGEWRLPFKMRLTAK